MAVRSAKATWPLTLQTAIDGARVAGDMPGAGLSNVSTMVDGSSAELSEEHLRAGGESTFTVQLLFGRHLQI